MKFGIRECANIVFRAKQETKIGTETFHVGQPVLYIDTATTSSMEQSATTVYANGGRGNAQLMAWEGEKTLTFTVEDALLSPIGFAILSGAGLFKNGDGNQTGETDDRVHFHMTTMANADANGAFDLSDALAEFGVTPGANVGDPAVYTAKISAADSPLYIIVTEDDGSITGEIYSNATVSGNKVTVAAAANKSAMIDYYVELPGAHVWEADITPDTFGGYYYVEADTLFRRQADGKDMPANLTFPNVKLQSNFTISMASTGDPSTFTFTMDAFPGYTYFDKSKKVLCVLQIAEGATKAAVEGSKPVMPYNVTKEHEDIFVDDSVAANDPT
jgi:hypothetical protein